jgi:hypothetical protein
MTLVDDAPALDDVLPSNSLTPSAAGPSLAWTKPIVRELFGADTGMSAPLRPL